MGEASEERVCTGCGEVMDMDDPDSLCADCWEDSLDGLDLEDQFDKLMGDRDE